jgi:exopolysaccharide biosynthesis polyprenyl glycosylphosphotransferase
VADVFAVLLSFASAFLLYTIGNGRSVPYTFWQFMGLGCVATLIFMFLFQSWKLYENEASLLNVVEARRLLLSWTFGSLLLFSFTFYFRVLDLSRIMLTTALGISYVMLNIERAILTGYAIRWVASGNPHHKAVIYGAGVVGKHLFKRIFHSPALGLKVIGFLDDDEALWGNTVRIGEIAERPEHKVIGGLSLLQKISKEHDVKEIFIAMPSATYQRNLEIAEAARKLNMKVSVVPPTYGHLMHTLEVRELGGIPVIQERRSEPHIFYPILKRVFDLIVSATAILLLSPVMIGIAIMIRADSPGPILFRQKRVGLNGKEFSFYKFRSMFADANPYGLTPKTSKDPRVTRFGRWLRRSSLDELPQFFNVIRGDMSIVGPRPEMPFIVSTYNEEQRERLKVRPGITGVWQISAVRGEPIHANMEYDLFYIEHRSLLLDLIIMVKTVATAIRGIGAY